MKFSGIVLRLGFLFSFAFLLFFGGTKYTFAYIIFDQSPVDETFNAAILNTPQFVSFGCTAELNCKVSGQTVYDVGVWIKKVGNPAAIRLQVANTWNDPTGGTSIFSDSISVSSISDTTYNSKWDVIALILSVPIGGVMSSRYNAEDVCNNPPHCMCHLHW